MLCIDIDCVQSTLKKNSVDFDEFFDRDLSLFRGLFSNVLYFNTILFKNVFLTVENGCDKFKYKSYQIHTSIE